MFDSVPAGAEQFDDRDINAIYADYFRRVREIAATGLVDCLAHVDLIKIHGHRPNAEIDAIVSETLDFIRSRDLAIELSTAGWRKPVNELYPADRIIELAMEKGIPFTTASDAHSHVQLAENFARLSEKMFSFGIREVCVFEKHKRELRAVSPTRGGSASPAIIADRVATFPGPTIAFESRKAGANQARGGGRVADRFRVQILRSGCLQTPRHCAPPKDAAQS